ncbi:MAG: hypothetical protein AAFX87_03735 [Bacteroidota bacterium]
MSKHNRRTLKNLFRFGSRPSEESFEKLIDSSLNLIDDGFSKTFDDGMQISPGSESKNDRLLSFYKDISDPKPEWYVGLHKEKGGEKYGLSIGRKDEKKGKLHLSADGDVGVGTEDPKAKLHVNGNLYVSKKLKVNDFMIMKGRTGAFGHTHSVPANGEWHSIIEGLMDCQAFEVVARAGAERAAGKYALAHAIAVNTYANSIDLIQSKQGESNFFKRLQGVLGYNSKGTIKISKTQAFYGHRKNRIKMRWRSYEVKNGGYYPYRYDLQIKTASDYGPKGHIKFSITHLWGDKEMGLSEE